MIRPLSCFAALAALALAGGPAWAQEAAEPHPLTLEEARRLALERNADFRMAQIQVEAALAQLKTVREFPNPTLGLSTAKISTDGTPEGTILGNSLYNRAYDSIASLSQLFAVAKRGLQRGAASAGVLAAQSQRDDARRLLLQAVVQDYAAAVAARAEADVMVQSAAKLRREADIAAHRNRAGDLSKSDQAQLEIAADQDELNAEAERATAQAAVVTLETLLGEPQPQGRTALADSLEGMAGTAGPDPEQLPMGARPDIAAAEATLKQAETNVTLARRQRIPDVTLSVQYERNPPFNPPSQINTVGVGVSLPLPLWNHYRGEILAATAARDQAQAQLDKARIQAASDVAAARVAYREASRRARRYRSSLAPKSAQVEASVAYAYEKGGASLVDLLEAERNDNAIRVAAVQAHADTAAAEAVLFAALGRPDPPAAPINPRLHQP